MIDQAVNYFSQNGEYAEGMATVNRPCLKTDYPRYFIDELALFSAAANGSVPNPPLMSVSRAPPHSRPCQTRQSVLTNRHLGEISRFAETSGYLAARFMLAFGSNKYFPGKGMNHHQLEKDIEHLEHVISHISAADRIPLSYWRSRIKSVSDVALVPSQASRVKRLNEALSALEAREELAPSAGSAR
jgi:hypothetical protein